jgi:hypothetical protein
MRVAGWHLGTFACTPESSPPRTANNALSVLSKSHVRPWLPWATSTVAWIMGKTSEGEGAVGLEDART